MTTGSVTQPLAPTRFGTNLHRLAVSRNVRIRTRLPLLAATPGPRTLLASLAAILGLSRDLGSEKNLWFFDSRFSVSN